MSEESLSAQRPAAAVDSEDAGQPYPGWDGRYNNKHNRSHSFSDMSTPTTWFIQSSFSVVLSFFLSIRSWVETPPSEDKDTQCMLARSPKLGMRQRGCG